MIRLNELQKKAGEEFELKWDENERKVCSEYMYAGTVRDNRKRVLDLWLI